MRKIADRQKRFSVDRAEKPWKCCFGGFLMLFTLLFFFMSRGHDLTEACRIKKEKNLVYKVKGEAV